MIKKKIIFGGYLGVELNSDHVIMIFFLGVYTFHVSHLNLCCFWLVKGNWLDIDPFIQETKKKKRRSYWLMSLVVHHQHYRYIDIWLFAPPLPKKKPNCWMSLELNNLTTKSNLDFFCFLFWCRWTVMMIIIIHKWIYDQGSLYNFVGVGVVYMELY